jgi:hypothetical protein
MRSFLVYGTLCIIAAKVSYSLVKMFGNSSWAEVTQQFYQPTCLMRFHADVRSQVAYLWSVLKLYFELCRFIPWLLALLLPVWRVRCWLVGRISLRKTIKNVAWPNSSAVCKWKICLLKPLYVPCHTHSVIYRFTCFKASEEHDVFLLISLLIFSGDKFYVDLNLGDLTAIVSDYFSIKYRS